jgi:archaellum component FlaG (FlaF/FlaG flagellin family)
MHPKFCMYDHFHIINNPCKYKCDTSQSFYTYIYKNYGECKMQFMNSGFNNILSE